MRSDVLSLSVITNLLLAPSPDSFVVAHPPTNRLDSKLTAPVQVGDVDRWQMLIRHSVDFFDRPSDNEEKKSSFDEESGSFFSDISNDGTRVSDRRYIIATSRMLYALAHASRVDAKYLDRARRLRSFLLRAMIASDDKGPYFIPAINLAEKGVVEAWNQVEEKNEWVEKLPQELKVEEQAYGLCGLVALYSLEPTSVALEDIDELYISFRERFKDKNGTGFFDSYPSPNGKPRTKSYNSTVYVSTAFLFELHDTVRRIAASEVIGAQHRELARKVEAIAASDLAELADAVAEKMIDIDETGFIVEEFDGDWNPDWRGRVWPHDWRDKTPPKYDDTTSIVGHNFQSAWFLLRASQMPSVSQEHAKRYSDKAVQILRSMLSKPEEVQVSPWNTEEVWRASPVDSVNGGFHDIFRRNTGAPIYHTNKSWWQQCEGILALTLAEKVGVITDRNALDARDKAIQFFVNHFIDYEKGGEFEVVSQDGKLVKSEYKGHKGKSAYHTVELYRYLIDYAEMR